MKLRLAEDEVRDAIARLWSSLGPLSRGVLEIRLHVTLTWDGHELVLITPHSYEPPPWKYTSVETVGAMKRYRLCPGSVDNV